MTDDLAARATVLADLLRLCARIGAAPQLRDDDSVWLVGPGDAPARRLGDTIRAARWTLRRETKPKVRLRA